MDKDRKLASVISGQAGPLPNISRAAVRHACPCAGGQGEARAVAQTARDQAGRLFSKRVLGPPSSESLRNTGPSYCALGPFLYPRRPSCGGGTPRACIAEELNILLSTERLRLTGPLCRMGRRANTYLRDEAPPRPHLEQRRARSDLA